MAVFIEAKVSWIMPRKDGGIRTKIRFFKTDGPYTETDKEGFEHTTYKRTLIEEKIFDYKDPKELLTVVDSKISGEVTKADLVTTAKVFDQPLLESYREKVVIDDR